MSLEAKICFQTPGSEDDSGSPESIFLFGVAFHPHLELQGAPPWKHLKV